VPKKVSEIEKKRIIESFINGISIDELSKKYNLTKMTISRYLKKGIDTNIFESLENNNNTVNKIKSNAKDNLKNEYSINTIEDKQKDSESQFLNSSFIEIAPLNLDIENEPQKEVASVSILDVEFPKTVYMIVDSKTELQTKILRDYPDWQFLSKEDLSRKIIEVFFDIKIAKRNCSKEQKVIKVPNTDVFRIVAPILVSRGISRIICPETLISL
jgi:hypothetical protein